MQSRLAGVILVLVSAALFAMAGVFTKLVHADIWVTAGWRGLIGSLVTGAYFVWRRRRIGQSVSMRLGSFGWLFAALSIATQLLYIGALKYTYVANVAVIYAIAPFLAAGLAYAALGEKVRPLTISTATLSLAGVAWIVADGLGSGSGYGDLLALGMTVAFAVYMVAVRAAPDAPVLLAVAVSCFLLFLFSFVIASPLSVSGRDALFLVLFGLTFSTGVIFFTEGARLLPVADTALIGTMDVPFAAGFAWAFLNEVPPRATMIGGLVVVLAVAMQAVGDLAGARWQAWRAMRGRSDPTPPPA